MPPCEENFSSLPLGRSEIHAQTEGKKQSENKPKDNEEVCVIDKNVPWMTTAVTDLSMQNFVPLDRAYCSENFLMISKFFAVGPSHFVTRDTFDDEEEWRDAILVLFTRTEEDLAVKDVWEMAKLILNAWWIVNACVYVCIYIRDMRARYDMSLWRRSVKEFYLVFFGYTSAVCQGHNFFSFLSCALSQTKRSDFTKKRRNKRAGKYHHVLLL